VRGPCSVLFPPPFETQEATESERREEDKDKDEDTDTDTDTDA
jgi:hypothetical protein